MTGCRQFHKRHPFTGRPVYFAIRLTRTPRTKSRKPAPRTATKTSAGLYLDLDLRLPYVVRWFGLPFINPPRRPMGTTSAMIAIPHITREALSVVESVPEFDHLYSGHSWRCEPPAPLRRR